MHEVRSDDPLRRNSSRLPGNIIECLATKIDSLADQPRPAGCKKLRGADDLWRVRVGDYRIIYAVDDTAPVIEIRVIRHRKDAYGAA